MLDKLKSLVGTQVHLTKGDDCEIGSHYIKVNGKLETDENEDSFFVRTCDNYFGTSSVGFSSRHVEEIFKRVYEYQIVLKD